MNNPRMTAKERGLLKGAVRRVFSRSDLRRKVLEAIKIQYVDPARPRVKKWGICSDCKEKTPLYLMQVDHVDPIVPVDSALEHMSWDQVIDRTWCEERNLNPICIPCHKAKSKLESAVRRKNKKEGKKHE